MNLKALLNPYKGLPREIYILFIGRIVNCIGSFVHPLMSLILTQRIGMSALEAGKFVTILAVCQVPCIMLGGKLADTIGRRKVIITFQTLGAIMLFICGFMEPSVLSAKVMIVSACFYAISTPAYDALNADITNSTNRKEAYSLLYMGVNIGFSIGPIIGGFLYKNYLPLIFIGDAITTLLALVMFILFIKEPKREKIVNEKIMAEERINTNELEDDVKGSVFSVLIKRPILLLFPMMMLLEQFAYSQWGFALPLQMGDLFGQDGAKFYGFLGAFNGVIVIIFTPILTSFTKKYKPLKVMAVGGILYSLCFFMFSWINTMPLFFMGVLSLTLGEVLIAINSSAFIANNTPCSHRGRVSSILPLISGAGYAFGPMIMGGIIDAKGMFISWNIVGMAALVGSIGIYALKYIVKVNENTDLVECEEE